jgi:hypothetical protein
MTSSTHLTSLVLLHLFRQLPTLSAPRNQTPTPATKQTKTYISKGMSAGIFAFVFWFFLKVFLF